MIPVLKMKLYFEFAGSLFGTISGSAFVLAKINIQVQLILRQNTVMSEFYCLPITSLKL
jgi:hypothetical protein